MERRSASLNFTLRIRAVLLHTLLELIARRAYSIGWQDGTDRIFKDEDKVTIDPTQLRKFL